MAETDAPPVVNDTPEIQHQMPDEKSLLLSRARLMGLSVSNNSSIETLRAKVAAAMEGKTVDVTPGPASQPEQAVVGAPREMTQLEKQQLEQLALIRVRVFCNNPSKRDLPGEIFTFSNKVIGSIRKFVPFGDANRDGYHVPVCILTMIEDRMFQSVTYRRGEGGRMIPKTELIPEFNIQRLPPLTETQLAEMSKMQAAKGGLED